MRRRLKRRFPLTLTQFLVGLAIVVGFFMALRLSQNATNLQQVQNSEATFQAEVYIQNTIEVQLQATLEYVTSEAYIEEYNRSEARHIVDGEVRIVPLISQATPTPTPLPASLPDDATYAQPWQMWWYLLTDVEAPLQPLATPAPTPSP